MDGEMTGSPGEMDAETRGHGDEEAGNRDEQDAQDGEEGQTQGAGPAEDVPEVDRLRGELETARRQAVEGHRRALLAENAGRVVPELVIGDSVEGLEASLEVARRAFEAVRASTLAEVVAGAPVGAGNGQRDPAVDVETLSPMQKIAYGLKRSTE
jgi:hypothetical protein